MIKRFLNDESGIAMGLAVITIMLIGVMGAGLLVFVRNDLASVIEVNQGQQALDMADAGVQAAKNHLLTKNADFRSYDGVTDLTADPPNPESRWSCGSWDATNEVCAGTGHTLSNLDGNLGTPDARIWIQYLKPSTTTAQLNDPDYAPELVPDGETNYPPGKDYFKVLSEGYSGNAVRKVEAIYNTYSLGIPNAYYTPGNITLNGAAGTITNISLFAGGNVGGKGGQVLAGDDLAYEDWCRPPFNTASRSTVRAGIGALGSVANPVAGRDFGSNTSPQFVGSPSDTSSCSPASTTSQPTFPFRPSLPNIEGLRLAAQSQSNGIGGDNYYDLTANADMQKATAGATGPVWPANSLSSTVVFVKFDDIGDVLTWKMGGQCSDPPVRGTLVIENGRFTTSPNRTPLRGTVIIKSAGPGTEVYSDTGATCMQSFAIASGDITIGGAVSPATEERGNRPGFYDMQQWSWRECYSLNCN